MCDRELRIFQLPTLELPNAILTRLVIEVAEHSNVTLIGALPRQFTRPVVVDPDDNLFSEIYL